jgi:hypothetical protein
MERTKRTRRIWRAGVGIGVLALAVVAIWRLWPRERLLMEVARPIVKVDAEHTSVCWLSDQQLLIVTNKEAVGVGNRSGTSNPAHWQGSVDLLNIATHKRSHLTALANLFQREMIAPLTVPENLEASPDGNWLRWDTHAARGPWFMGHVVRRDGTHYRAWDRNRPNSAAKVEEDFFLDSGHLVQMTDYGPMMTVLDLLEPSRDKAIRELGQAETVLAQYARRQSVFHPEPQSGDGYVEVDMYRTQDRMKLILPESVGSRGAPVPLQMRKVRLPNGAELCESEVSSQQSVGYHLAVSRTPEFLSWLHRVIPKFTARPMVTEELWVSDAAGGMHKIGVVPIKLDASGKAEDPANGFEFFISDMRWLPDGKHISFIYRDTLYVVPAESGK